MGMATLPYSLMKGANDGINRWAGGMVAGPTKLPSHDKLTS